MEVQWRVRIDHSICQSLQWREMDSICLLPILTFVTFPGPPWRLVSGRLAGSKAVTELLVLSSSALSHLPMSVANMYPVFLSIYYMYLKDH